MHRAVKKYLWFRVNRKNYQFTCLPFGLATSREFTKLLRPVVAWLRRQSVKLHIYLDDWLTHTVSRTGPDAFQDDHRATPEARMGYQLRKVRPNTKPGLPVSGNAFQHSTVYIGAPAENASQGPVSSSALDEQPIVTARDLHSVLGMVVFMATLILHGRLRLWPVQWWAATAWCQRTGNWIDKITVPQWVLQEVAWWASPAVLQGLPLATQETEVTLFTDASNLGWGAQLGSCLIQGQWSASLRSSHINVLEMQAIINAVRGSLPHLRSRVVWLMCDNAVTVAYIKNEGGTRSYTHMQLTIHLPGVRNVQVDALSRIGTINTKWTLAMECLRPVFSKWGELQIDMFATFANRWLIKFVSLYPDPRAEWTDAMSLPGTTGGASCMRFHHSSGSFRCCRRSTSLMEYRWCW